MKNLTNNLEPALSQQNRPDEILLSPHFRLNEFLNIAKYPDNKPTLQDVVNMAYGCLLLLEPARAIVGPVIVNSGFRNSRVNRLVGGVDNSQHTRGQAADIRPADPRQFQRLVDFLKASSYTDQLLTGSTWLHISWSPFAQPRHFVRLGYYR
ncbi:MAG: peptidase M15 [Prevotella sp.]|nr:peptidase M15 [Prevotella sp.]MBP3850224.1 peptidase M15 [Prevotella sp.]